MVQVRALKAHQGPNGFVQVGDPVEVDPRRHRELAQNGIVPPPIAGEEPGVEGRQPGTVTSGTATRAPRRERITGDKKDK